jgi:hypothetical protein
MGRNVQLSRSAIERITLEGKGDVFRIVVSVVSAELMPTKIFLFSRGLVDPYTGDFAREFVCVVDPYEAAVYPPDEPREGQFPMFFRADSVDLCYPSSLSAETIWAELQSDVALLVAAYDRLDTLQTTATEIIE